MYNIKFNSSTSHTHTTGSLNGKHPGLTPGVYVDWVKEMQKVKATEENVPDLMVVEQADQGECLQLLSASVSIFTKLPF